MKVDLHEDGLLWLINRTVFHPRGFALAHTPGTDEWELQGDGDTPFVFTNADDDEGFDQSASCFERAEEWTP